MANDPHLDIRWSEESPAELNRLATQTVEVSFEPTDDPVQIVIYGTCPACRGPLRHIQPIEVFLAPDSPPEPTPAPQPTVSYRAIVWCDCRMQHPGSEGAMTGCGRYFGLDIEVSRS